MMLTGGGTFAWADTETFGADNATAKDTDITGTAVTIDKGSNPSGTGQYAVFNSKADNGLKLRTGSPLTLNVNEGYKVTNVTIYAYQNNEADAVMTCDSYAIDGTDAIAFGTAIDIPLNVKNANSQTLATISTGEIEATKSIVFNFTNPTGKTNQILAYIEVTYEPIINVIYTKSLDGWSSDDVTKTENTEGKWYNSTGMVNADYYTGMYIESNHGLHVGARDNSSAVTTTLSIKHTANSIITIDAVWYAGYNSSDSNTPYSVFSYGDFSLKQVLDSRTASGSKTSYTINGTTKYLTTGIDNDTFVDIHLTVNTYTRSITEFYLKSGDTYLAQFSDLTSSNNSFSENANYDAVSMSVYMKGSKTNAWTALKSLTISEKEQDVFTYTVNAAAGTNILKTLATGDALSGSSVTYYYPQVLNINGTLYQASSINSGYKSTFTLDADEKVVNHSYSQPATPITNLMFLAEGEDMFTKGTGSSADTRCSMGAGGYASSKTAFVTLPAGTYYMILTNRCSGNRTGIHKFYKGDEAEPFFSADGNGYNAQRESGEFTLDATTTLYMQGGDDKQYVDWIYIYGTIANNANMTNLIENADMETSAGGSEYWQEGVKGWNNAENAVNYRHLAFTDANNASGAFTGTNAFENWTNAAGGLTGQMSQTINGIPNGVYKLQLAALVRTVNGQFIYGKSNGKTYKTTLSGANEQANDYEVIVVVEDNQLEIGLDMNNAGADWAAIDNARLTYAPTVSQTVTNAGWATLYTPYALDFSGVEGLEAYTAACENNKVTLTKVDDVPANSGVVLKGAANTYSIPVIASSETNKGELTGSATEATAWNAYDGYNLYMLALNANSEAQFTKVTSGSVAAGKAFLKLSNTASRSLTVVIGDEATGISDATRLTDNGEGIKDNVYNLNGQRVNKPKKGLYVVNGKKVIINK